MSAAPELSSTDVPESPLSHNQIVTILIGLMLGMFLAALDQTIVATAIRTIADDLQGLDRQAWVTTAYLITSTIVTPLYGKLSDIYGRKPFFITAITVFVIGSVMCTFADSMIQLAAFRAVQGVGAGGLFSLALAIIGDIVPPMERAKYQGYFLAVFGTSSVLGPVIGGFFAGMTSFLGIAGWRWVFLVNVPIGIIALLVVMRTLHLRHTRLDHRIDWWGAAALSVGLVPLLLVAEQGREWGWGSTNSILCYVIGGVGVLAFLTIERWMGDEALLPIRLFTNKTIGISSIASTVLGIALFGGIACLPLYLQIVKGSSPTEAGLQLLPLTLGIMSGSIISGQTISRTGRYRVFLRLGAPLIAVALFIFHYIAWDTPMWQIMIVSALFGAGMGFMMQPLMLAVQSAADRRDMGIATASATFTRQIGGTLGTAVFLSILFSLLPDKIASSLKAAQGTSDFRKALADPANAEFVASLKSGVAGEGIMKDSSFLTSLDPRLAKPFLQGFADAMDHVFLVAALVMVVGAVITWMIPQIDLRRPAPGEAPVLAE
ncbi:MDR family MFS transporter [Nostocoides jenkinsii]|jgi:EmrB/QacA subfamily drug resistance transporter|uniref:Putative multidrug-efflux transporter n=1 Tax=Nostocoides jenkinsii Ben 74 TaxID=1193518 RepID=A0A077MGD5_9MICO|nr:MDR family MFS transporter [Tetrasphaera jenkinsii]CCI54397.1 putative multidrug-efflux transporter [Tetrasphaera jenkinsii Ben 74]